MAIVHNSLATSNGVVRTYNKGAAAQLCMKYFDRDRLPYDGESCNCTAKLNRHKANMPQTEVKLPWA